MGDPRTWPLWCLDNPENFPSVFVPIINQEVYEFLQGEKAFSQALVSRLRQAKAVVCLTKSGFDAKYMSDNNLVFHYVPHAVPFISPVVDFRRETEIPPEKKLLLCVGPYHDIENQLWLIHDLRTMAGDWVLVTIGNVIDKDYFEMIKKATKNDSRFIILGPVDRHIVASAMEEADLLIEPSVAEAFPLAVLEAISHNLPWVASENDTGIMDLKGGSAVPLNGFNKEILELLSNPSRRMKLAEDGFSEWKKRHRMDLVAREYLRLVGLEPDPSNGVSYINNDITPGREYIRLLRSPHKEKPLVTVIIPSYSRPEQLVDAIKSVIDQSYENLEIIVINDYGTNVEDEISQLNDSRIIYHTNERNLGLAGTRNVGVNISHGEYIAYLDDDDIYYPCHIETLAWIPMLTF